MKYRSEMESKSDRKKRKDREKAEVAKALRILRKGHAVKMSGKDVITIIFPEAHGGQRPCRMRPR